MKRNWLLYLVIFSLALNLGIIGTLIYWRHQAKQHLAALEEAPPLRLGEAWRHQLTPEQRQSLRGCIQPHSRQVRAMREELMTKRQELFQLMKEQPEKWDSIREKLQEINRLQGGMEEKMVRHLLEVQSQLQPEQRTLFLQAVEQHLSNMWGGLGRRHPGGHPRQPGTGRGPCPGPGPACPPE